jgi:hypothetical protein
MCIILIPSEIVSFCSFGGAEVAILTKPFNEFRLYIIPVMQELCSVLDLYFYILSLGMRIMSTFGVKQQSFVYLLWIDYMVLVLSRVCYVFTINEL